MKKKFFATIILTVITCIMLCISVSASEYDNFTKERDYNELLESLIKRNLSYAPYSLYTADENKTWYFENVKTAYELGILDLKEQQIKNNFIEKVSIGDVIIGYSKIASKYLTNSFNQSSFFYYALKIGLINQNEYDNLGKLQQLKADTLTADSFQYDYYATRKDIQILTNRLFKIISPGEYINNFTKLVDVDEIKTPNVSVDGVLQLYNLGIIAGNSQGMFTPYQHLTLPEYATIITRICIPEKRQRIDETTYEKFYSQEISVNTYNSISTEDATNYIAENKIDKTFSTVLAPEDIVTYEDVIASFWGVATTFHRHAPANEVLESIYTLFPLKNFITEEDLTKPATKSKAAIFAMFLANDEKEIAITTTQTLKPELMSYFYNYELPFVNMALSIGVLENTEQDINNAYLTKADLDKMLTIYGRALHTNYPYNTIRKGRDMAKLVTDPAMLPSNANVYPYILDFAPKEVYENIPAEFSQSPLYLSTHLSELYPETINLWEQALNDILDIDYTHNPCQHLRHSKLVNISHISSKEYKEYYNTLLSQYTQHVIDNEIILKGEAKVLLPIVYSAKDSLLYKVRVKLEFEVIHSKTNKNLLLFDNDVTYNGNKFEVYVDLPATGDAFRNLAFKFINFSCLMKDIVYGGENIIVNK